MTGTMRRRWIAAGSLLVGVFGGAAAAQVVEKASRARWLDTGIFALKADDKANFYITLNENAANGPALVRLQFLDQAGTPTFTDDVMLQPGQSTRVQASGPNFLRARAQVLNGSLQLTAQPLVLGTVEVLNLTTAQRGPVCTIHDYGGDDQRQ
jgi:hypothetical protein